MKTELYTQFKPYSAYSKPKKSTKSEVINLTPALDVASTSKKSEIPTSVKIGAAVGAGLGVIAGKYVISPKIFPKWKAREPREIIQMLSMAYAADILGATGGLIGDKNKSKAKAKKKFHEVAFQMMNTTIPMAMVTCAIKLCENVKQLNNKPAKIIASIGAMITGAILATTITNEISNDNQPKRKYGPKDTLANVDDAAAVIVIGFPDLKKLETVAKSALPFIYGFCGYRAGIKE